MNVTGIGNVVGIEGLEPEQILDEIQRGAKFVTFEYCVSIVLMTFKRKSDVYYIRPGENRVAKGMGFTLLSATMGWWGFPWGLIYTLNSFVTNFRGGNDLTMLVASRLFPMEMAMAIPPGGWGQAIERGRPAPPEAAPHYYSQPPPP